MKYLGNYSGWISPTWLEEIESTPGKDMYLESNLQSCNTARHEEYARCLEAKWDMTRKFWTHHNSDNVSFNITPPWVNSRYEWWIVKLMPGEVIPVHVDIDADVACNRFWMPLLDYQPGHIFFLEDNVILDYKAGDLYQYDTSTSLHGSANFGYSQRITLLVTEYL